MKNFFKKLSFVLAIAMVLTSLAPATASAAAKNYVKDSRTGKKVTAIYAYIGGSVATLTPYVNGKKASKVTIENSDPTKVDVSNKGVVTPLKNGTATLTFKSGKTTIAKVTVKARTRAKSLNIYDRAEYAAGKKEKLTEVALKVGETKDLQVTMPISKAAKKAGGKKSSYFAYAKSSNEDVVTVTKNDDTQRNFTVKAVKAGTAKVTIVANQKTEKNVRADKYAVEASFDVTVKDDSIEAKQTGVNKITVKGADLTDKVADYVVKRGTVTLSVKSVTLNDAKTEAVLQAASSTMPKGDYTLSFNKGEEVAFSVEEGVVSKIVVDPEVAILDTAKTAYTFFKILNQFDEDVTKAEAGNCTITGAVQDGTDPYKLNFTSTTDYTLNLSTVALSIVCNKNGVNYVGVLNVSAAAKLAETEFKGLYKYNTTTGKYEVATITVNDTPGDFYLLFSAVDQYGRSAVAYAANSLQVNLSSVTGLTCVTNAAIAVDNVPYLAFKLVGPIANAGNVTILGVQLTDGKTVKGEFTVAQKQLVDSLTVTASTDVYGNQKNVLEFTALDQDGKEIKDYATLSRLNGKFSPAGVAFDVNPDGTARLELNADPNTTTIASPIVVTWLSETNKFGSVNLSVRPNRVLSAVIGVKASKTLSVTENGTITIAPADFLYQDQYGNTISDADLAKVYTNSTEKNIVIEAASTYDSAVFSTTVTSAAVAANSTTAAINTTAGAKPGKLTLKVSIVNVKASDTTITIENASVKTAANFEIGDIDRVQVATTGAATATADFDVYGYANGAKVKLIRGTDYTVYNNTDKVSAIDVTKEGYTVKEAELVVIINNAAGTTLTKKFEYSNAPSEVKSVVANASFKGNISVATDTAVDADVVRLSADPVPGNANAVLNVRDQYNKNCNIAPRVTFSGYSADATLDHNGTTTASIKWATVGYKTVTVKYVWDNGTTFETTLTINVH